LAIGEGIRVLLPTDGSIPALAATHQAVELVRRMKGELIILVVKEQNPVMPIERLAEDNALMRSERVDGAEYAARLAEKNHVRCEVHVREGSVVGEILKATEEMQIQMIIMGSSNPRGLSGWFLGHVAEAVLKASPVTVTVVKPNSADIQGIVESARSFTLPKVEAPLVQTASDMRKIRVGLVLFSAYVLLYSCFAFLGSFSKVVLGTAFLGMNLGVVIGGALIAVAIVVAISYNWYASRVERSGGGA